MSIAVNNLYFIEKWTQLQIIFEAVDSNDREILAKYPTGVKVSHRAYSKDEVVLLKRFST
jgi:hypothetical protein